jgi:isochorismate hydrolase
MEIGFDKVFDAIEYNIQFNEEAQAKVSLLREKIEELKNIFETEDINVLKTLEFKLKKKIVKKNKNKEVVREDTIKAIVEDTTEKQTVLSEHVLTEETLKL